MDIEEALYRVGNELEMVAMECFAPDNRRGQDVEQLPIAWELIMRNIEEAKALKEELTKEKEQ